MITICKECGKKYQVNLDKIVKSRARFRCNRCGSQIVVAKPSQPQVAATTPAAHQHHPPQDMDPRIDTREDAQIKIKGLSIRFKLIAIIVSLMVTSISIAGFISIQHSRDALATQAQEHLLRDVRLKSNEYALSFERIREEAIGVASYVSRTYQRENITEEIDMKILMPWDGQKYGNPELDAQLASEKRFLQQIGLVLKSTVSQNPYLSIGYFGTETGLTVFDDDTTVKVIEKLEAFDVTQRPWYIEAKELKQVIWTEPYVDANTQQLVVTCAVPVYAVDKRLLGVVGFDVLLETIQTDILTLDIGYDSYAFLINGVGGVLVRPGMDAQDARWDTTYKTDNLLTTENQEFNAIIKTMTTLQTGISQYYSSGDIKIIAYAPIKAINASMAIVASMDEVTGPAIAIRNLIAGVFVVVLLVSIVIGLLIGNSITRPINELIVQADLISMGKRNLEVLETDRRDEIGVLTQSFNRLVISLKMAMSRI